MRKFFYCFAFFVPMVSLLFNACDKVLKYDVPVIGISFSGVDNDFRKAAVQNAMNSIADLGWGYAYKPSLNLEDQVLRLDSILERGCDALIVMPQNRELFGKDIIKKVNELGIPLICFEEKPESDDVEYAAFVSGDNVGAGTNAAAFMADTLSKIAETSKKVLLMTVPSEPASQVRINAFKKEGDKYLGFVAVDECALNSYSREEAKAKFEMWIKALSPLAQRPHAVYAQDDEIALGVLDAIENLNIDDIKVVVGCGVSEKFLKRIKDSTEKLVLASTYYSPRMIHLCVEIASQIILYGEDPEQVKDNVIGATVINKSNVDEYYNDLFTY